ncbi:MAG: hypothetical protein KBC81_01620 [Candidatus Pacebacteria bacterium]|nr:hypothetical protein [Candidatus Paceibacterota bacterium]
MAEVLFNRLAKAENKAESAGIEAMGADGKDLNGMLLKDRASSKHVLESLEEIGIDVSNNFIKRLTPEMVENADKIVVIVKPETVPDFLKGNGKIIYWDITDPDEQTLEFHRQTLNKIKKLVADFINDLKL